MQDTACRRASAQVGQHRHVAPCAGQGVASLQHACDQVCADAACRKQTACASGTHRWYVPLCSSGPAGHSRSRAARRQHRRKRRASSCFGARELSSTCGCVCGSMLAMILASPFLPAAELTVWVCRLGWCRRTDRAGQRHTSRFNAQTRCWCQRAVWFLCTAARKTCWPAQLPNTLAGWLCWHAPLIQPETGARWKAGRRSTARNVGVGG